MSDDATATGGQTAGVDGQEEVVIGDRIWQAEVISSYGRVIHDSEHGDNGGTGPAADVQASGPKWLADLTAIYRRYEVDGVTPTIAELAAVITAVTPAATDVASYRVCAAQTYAELEDERERVESLTEKIAELESVIASGVLDRLKKVPRKPRAAKPPEIKVPKKDMRGQHKVLPEGKRVGKVVVGKQVGRRKSGYIVYAAQCDCGNATEVTSVELQRWGDRSGCEKCRPQKGRQKGWRKFKNQQPAVASV